MGSTGAQGSGWSRGGLSSLPALAVALAAWLSGLPALAAEPVTLQLKWLHGFQFAGYYAALQQGYYREAGLDVRILEGRPDTDVVASVVKGKAEFGVGTSSLVLDRAAGKPVVALAAIFQHSPYVLIARRDRPGGSVHDLAGKRVMLEQQSAEIQAYLQREGIPATGFKRLEHTFDVRDLIEGRTDAVAAYVSNQPWFLERAGFAFDAFSPRSAGIDFYGDNLFTSERMIRERPEVVRAFRAASLRGWQHAKDHPEAAVELILGKYTQRHPREYWAFEGEQLLRLMQPDLVELGYMSAGRWRHIADTYADIGMLARGVSLDGFLYDADPKPEFSRLYALVAAIFAITLCVGGAATHVLRLNRRLARSMADNARAQAELAESETRFRTLAETSSACIYVLRDQHFVMVNPACSALSGYAREELLGKPLLDVIHPDDRERVGKVARSRESGGPFPARYEVRLLRKDGGVRWMEVSSALTIFDGLPSVVGTVFDVTERRRAQEERFRQLFDAAPLPMVYITGEPGKRRFEVVNRRFTGVFGYAAEEVPDAKSWMALAYPDEAYRSAIAASWTSALARSDRTGEDVSPQEYRVTCKSGAVLTMLVGGAPAGEGYLLTFVDITERKAAELAVEASRSQLEDRTRQVQVLNAQLARRADEAEAARRAKDAFLANMSHELRTPMNAIIGFGGLIDEKALPPRQREWLGMLRQSARDLLRSIDGILDVTRAQAGQIALEDVDFSPAVVVREVGALMADRATARGLALEVDTGSVADLRVRGDPTRLAQALLNYVDNAVKFTDQGTVTLAVRVAGAPTSSIPMRFEVRDTGAGIPDEARKTLFSTFQQADETLARPAGGMGIGLALTKQLSRLMGGEVGCESVVGQGSLFWFTARFSPAVPALAASSPSAAEGRQSLGAALDRLETLLKRGDIDANLWLDRCEAMLAAAAPEEAAVIRRHVERFDYGPALEALGRLRRRALEA